MKYEILFKTDKIQEEDRPWGIPCRKPFHLRLKKLSFYLGERNGEFKEQWQSILKPAERQLLSTLLLKYREDLEMAEEKAYKTIKVNRDLLSKEEMEHICEQLRGIHESCRKCRYCKARKVDGNIFTGSERWQWLMTRTHVDREEFCSNGLLSSGSQLVKNDDSNYTETEGEDQCIIAGYKGIFSVGMW